MKTFIFEVTTVNGYVLARVDAKDKCEAIKIVKNMYPTSFIMQVEN